MNVPDSARAAQAKIQRGRAVYATDDGCLHHGASLGFGKLDGNVVTCRAHGWRYDVTTGKTLHVPDYGVGCYPVKIVDGKIFVSLV